MRTHGKRCSAWRMVRASAGMLSVPCATGACTPAIAKGVMPSTLARRPGTALDHFPRGSASLPPRGSAALLPVPGDPGPAEAALHPVAGLPHGEAVRPLDIGAGQPDPFAAVGLPLPVAGMPDHRPAGGRRHGL